MGGMAISTAAMPRDAAGVMSNLCRATQNAPPARTDAPAGLSKQSPYVLLLDGGRHGAGGGRLHGLLDSFLVVFPRGLGGRGGGRFGSGGAGCVGRGRLRRGECQGHGGECQGKGQDRRFHLVFSPSRALSPAHNSILRLARRKLDSLRRLRRPTKSGASGLMFIRILFSPGWGYAQRLSLIHISEPT